MNTPKEPGDYLLQDEWGLYTKATLFSDGKMVYRNFYWTEQEALEDSTNVYGGIVPLHKYVSPNCRWSVIKKNSNKK